MLNDLQSHVRELAGCIGSGVTPRFRRRALSDDTSEAVLGLQSGGKIATAEGWAFVKARGAVEPVRGAAGDAARGSGCTGSPGRPARLIVIAIGRPRSQGPRLPKRPNTGDWVEIRLSGLHAADETSLDAAKEADAVATSNFVGPEKLAGSARHPT